MKHRHALLATSALWLALAGCATTQPSRPIAETAATTPSLSTLNRLIAQAGLAETLNGGGPYTMFAPTDEAFRALPAKTLDGLAKDREQLKAVLLYHVLPGRVAAADIPNGKAKSAQGAEVAVARTAGMVTVEDALVTQADVPASNGVLHVIDRVLMPPKR
jgi:uncharacterized surface protein with fasciclin (FAS1) repeats